MICNLFNVLETPHTNYKRKFC